MTLEAPYNSKRISSAAEEIAALRREALAYKAVRSALRSAQTTEDVAQRVFKKVAFHSKSQLNILILCRFSTRTSSTCCRCLTCGVHVQHQRHLISMLFRKGDLSYNDLRIRVRILEMDRLSTPSWQMVTRTEMFLRRLRHLVR
jgi:hypothetical protein